MLDNNYDLAASFDGDGDRLIISLKNGKILNGDLMLYFFATELKRRKKLKENKVIYSIIANRGITKALEEEGIRVKLVNVGDENISKEIKAGVSLLGGEKSGHLIFSKKYNYSCALTSILKFLSLLNDEAIIRLNTLNEYYEVSKNYEQLKMPNRLLHHLRRIVKSGYVNIRQSGTERLYRLVLMSPRNEEIIEALSFLEKWNIKKN